MRTTGGLPPSSSDERASADERQATAHRHVPLASPAAIGVVGATGQVGGVTASPRNVVFRQRGSVFASVRSAGSTLLGMVPML